MHNIKFLHPKTTDSLCKFLDMSANQYLDGDGVPLIGSIVDNDGTLMQFNNGFLDSPHDDYPALQTRDSKYVEYRRNGLLHRDHFKPALIFRLSDRIRYEWWVKGVMARVQEILLTCSKDPVAHEI
jgi:hypothetical protein